MKSKTKISAISGYFALIRVISGYGEKKIPFLAFDSRGINSTVDWLTFLFKMFAT